MAGMIPSKRKMGLPGKMTRLLIIVAGVALWAGCPRDASCPRPVRQIFVDPEIQALTETERNAELARIQDLLTRSYPHLREKQERFGLRVEAIVEEHRPELHRAVNRYQYQSVFDRILVAFHDGHLAVRGFGRSFRNTYRPPAAPPRPPSRPLPDPVTVGVGLTLRFVEGHVAVTEVRPGSTADRAGVRRGDVILMAGDQAALARLGAVLRYRSWARLEAGLQLAASRVMITRPWRPGTPLPTERLVLSRAGRRFSVTLSGGPVPDRIERAFRYRPARCGVGVLRASTFVGPRSTLGKKLRAALAEARQARGLVLDLRGNRGGDQGLARTLVRQLLHAPVTAGEYRYLRTRELAEHIPVIPSLPVDPAHPRWTTWQKDRLAPAPDHLAVPLVVLTDALCASSCEVVARALSAMPGARLVGEATAGSSGLPVIVMLPHSRLRISLPSWQARTPRGKLLEGHGVEPDERVPLTLAGLEAGRDEALERGLDHLCKALAADSASRLGSASPRRSP